MGVYDLLTEKVIIEKVVRDCILNKKLIYQAAPFPVGSLCRLQKFTQRGYSCSMGNLLKLCFNISDLDLRDPDVFKSELKGCYEDFSRLFIKQLTDKYLNSLPLKIKLTLEDLCLIIDDCFKV